MKDERKIQEVEKLFRVLEEMTNLLQSQQTLYLKEKERLDSFTRTNAIINKAKGAIKLINENKFTVLLATSVLVSTASYVVNEIFDGKKASSDSYGGTDGEMTKPRDQFIAENQKYTIMKILTDIGIWASFGIAEFATIMYLDRNRLSKERSSETLKKMESC